MEKDISGIVPPQYTGQEITTTASIELYDETEASRFFNLAMNRLLDVNDWNETAEGISATFQVTDSAGDDVERNVQQGDFLRIDIPGPGSRKGEGFDWVQVEELRHQAENNTESVAFRVRPCENPKGNKSGIAHFYDKTATSNFIVQRVGKKVTALVIDKNLQPNKDTGSITDKLRDKAVGTAAIAAFSKIQWQNLADGIVQNDHT